MRTDPRIACRNVREAFMWAFLHDAIAHPLMALTNWSRLSLRFHDWTSLKAWPRAELPALITWEINGAFGPVTVTYLASNYYSVQHPTVRHAFVTTATCAAQAAGKASSWFSILADEFGGDFLKP